MYAIVDIETTGGYAADNGITEIAIHISDGKKVIETFETLINPLQPLPTYIQAMTGISNAMVATAPEFKEVADKVATLLANKIFIAHNVNFDYSFVKSQLAAAGFILNVQKLCTVRLSRKIIPGYPSYSLGKLCQALTIPMQNRHRAGGDCAATAILFHHLLEKDKDGFIVKSLQRNSKEQILPPHVPKEDFDKLPYTPGVYYFHNAKGKIIYVGKAINLRYRVNSHFSNNTVSRQKQNFILHTHHISYQPCATELMASILESTEIKKRWPAFNHSQKRWEDLYSIFCYEDQNGYLRLGIDKKKQRLNAVYSFHYLTDGHTILRKLIKEYALCPKLCGMQKDDTACVGLEESCKGACTKKETPKTYNKKISRAIASLQTTPSYAIVENGLDNTDISCVLIVNGSFYGMGYLAANTPLGSVDVLKEMITPYKENLFIRNLVTAYAARHPEKVSLLG